MAKNKMEENTQVLDFDLDLTEEPVQVPIRETPIEEPKKVVKKAPKSSTAEEPVINCLRNERIIVRHIPKLSGMWGNNPKHVLAGGMAEGAIRVFVVPKLSSGVFVNVLTDREKTFLEEALGLEFNELSVYKKVNNFWDDSNESGINKVRLAKQDNYLDLSSPEDYIRYKILLANKDFIAPSLQMLQDCPKATYQFVLISEGDETKMAKNNLSSTMQCYKEFGKIEDDADTLRTIIETIDGRPIASTSKLEFLQTKANKLIQTDSKLFLKIIQDPTLSTKVLIKRCIEAGLIANRDNHLYLRSTNSPLCEDGEESTLNTAAIYLNRPKHQDIKFSLEAKLGK